MKEHLNVLKLLEKKYGNREALALLLGTTAKSIYFWEYRKVIPAEYHGKIIALGIAPRTVIPEYDDLIRKSEALAEIK